MPVSRGLAAHSEGFRTVASCWYASSGKPRLVWLTALRTSEASTVVLMGSRGPVYLPRGYRTPKTRVSLFGRSWYTSVCYTPYACNQSKRRGKRALG